MPTTHQTHQDMITPLTRTESSKLSKLNDWYDVVVTGLWEGRFVFVASDAGAAVFTEPNQYYGPIFGDVGKWWIGVGVDVSMPVYFKEQPDESFEFVDLAANDEIETALEDLGHTVRCGWR